MFWYFSTFIFHGMLVQAGVSERWGVRAVSDNPCGGLMSARATELSSSGPETVTETGRTSCRNPTLKAF